MRDRRPFWIIFTGVFLFHIGAIVIVGLNPVPEKKAPFQQKHLLVKTIPLQPKLQPEFLIAEAAPAPASVSAPVPAPTPIPSSSPATPPLSPTPPPKPATPSPAPPKPKPAAPLPKKPAPLKKETPSKPISVPKPTPPPTPPAPCASPQKQALLAKAQSSLAQISHASPVSTPTSTVSSSVLEMTALPNNGNQSTASYQSLIAQQLQNSLRLPERGQVHISLTLNKHGKILEFKIMSASSVKNRSYVEKEIPKMVFAPFGAFLTGQEKEIFELTLQDISN